MRVLFVQPYLTFPGVMDDTLPGELAKRGHEVLVAAYARKELPPSTVPGLNFLRVDGYSLSIPGYVSEFPYLKDLQGVIRSFGPDIVHANNLPFLTTWQAARSSRVLGKKMVTHVHGVIGERAFLFNLLQRMFISTFGRSIFHNSDRIICLNSSDAAEIVEHGAQKSKIVIIPNGINTQKFSPGRIRRDNTILWSGRFVKQKGLGYLIEAMDILVNKKKIPGIKLFLTGDGPTLFQVKKQVMRLRLEQEINFTGRVSREEVAELMASCSIYVLPSINEGMPYALLEAMSSGSAIVASDLPGIAEVVTQNETGLLVPPKDPVPLAESIERLLNQKELRERLSSNARNRMVKDYDWGQIVARVEELYRDLSQKSN